MLFMLMSAVVFQLFFHFFQCHFQGVPSQGGAFDADRHLGDVFQGNGGFQFFQLGVISDFAAIISRKRRQRRRPSSTVLP